MTLPSLGTAVIGAAALMAPGVGPPKWHVVPVTPSLVLCSSPDAGAAVSRPASIVTVLQSEVLGGLPGKRITTLLVHFPPRAFTPKHVHGGAVTAYVLAGHVRSQLDDGPAGVFQRGEMFYEPVGTTHTFIENPSGDEPAEVLATIVHGRVPGSGVGGGHRGEPG